MCIYQAIIHVPFNDHDCDHTNDYDRISDKLISVQCSDMICCRQATSHYSKCWSSVDNYRQQATIRLTHWLLVMPHGITEPSHHWFRLFRQFGQWWLTVIHQTVIPPQLPKLYLSHQSLKLAWKLLIQNVIKFPSDHWVDPNPPQWFPNRSVSTTGIKMAFFKMVASLCNGDITLNYW